jgi:hypothetical protein
MNPPLGQFITSQYMAIMQYLPEAQILVPALMII